MATVSKAYSGIGAMSPPSASIASYSSRTARKTPIVARASCTCVSAASTSQAVFLHATYRVMFPVLYLAPEHLLRERLQGWKHAVLRASHTRPERVVQRRVADVLVRVPVPQRLEVIEQRMSDQDLVLQQREDSREDLLKRRGWVSAGLLRIPSSIGHSPPSRSFARIPLSGCQLGRSERKLTLGLVVPHVLGVHEDVGVVQDLALVVDERDAAVSFTSVGELTVPAGVSTSAPFRSL